MTVRDVWIPISPAEAYDRLMILDLKLVHLMDTETRHHVRSARITIVEAMATVDYPQDNVLALVAGLAAINDQLWQAEDRIRACLAHDGTDAQIATIARLIVNLNDRRSAMKHAINQTLGASAPQDEKQYTRGAPAHETP